MSEPINILKRVDGPLISQEELDKVCEAIRDAMPTGEQLAAHMSALLKPLGQPAPRDPLPKENTQVIGLANLRRATDG